MKYLILLSILMSCAKQPVFYKAQVISLFRNHQLKTISDTAFTMVAVVDKDTIKLNYRKGNGLLYFEKDSVEIDSVHCKTIMGLYDYDERLITDKKRWYVQIANKSNL